MGLWGALKGVAKALLPFAVARGLDVYRQKNPKSGWLIDALEGQLLSIETDPATQHLPPNKKVLVATKRLQEAFPGTSKAESQHIARLILKERQVKNT